MSESGPVSGDMTPEHVNLRILSPEQVLFEGRALWVEIPLYDGLIGIWPGHAPLIGSVSKGTIRFETDGGIRELPIGSGVLRVRPTECAVLVGALGQDSSSERENSKALFGGLEETLIESLSEEDAQEIESE